MTTAPQQSVHVRPGYMLLVSLLAALGGMMFGFDIAIISGAAPFVQEHFHLNELQLGWGVSSLLAGCMLGAMVAGHLADEFGRKRTLLSIALVFAFASVLSAGFLFGRVEGLVGLILLFIASFAGCIGPVFWVLMSEIFPSCTRGLAMWVAVFTNWSANFAVVLFFPWMLKNTGGSVTFGFLAVMSLVMILFTWKMVTETSGRTLEEIERDWGASSILVPN